MPSARLSVDQRARSLTGACIPRIVQRVANQRAEHRHRGIVDQAILYFRDERHVVPVIDVSSRGMMIDADIDAHIGESVDLQLAEHARTRSTVRWVRDGRVGLEFVDGTIAWDWLASVPALPPVDGERETFVRDRAPRHAVMRLGSLLWNGMRIPVRMQNVSGEGAQLDGGGEFGAGARVELDLGDAGLASAEVRWAKDGQVGLRFDETFDMHRLLTSAGRQRERDEDKAADRFETISLGELLSRAG